MSRTGGLTLTHNSDVARERAAWLALAGLLAATVLCAGCLGAWWSAQTRLPAAPLPSGFVTRACVAWGRSAGRFQIGASWVPSVSATGRFGIPKRPYISNTSACGFLPWAPFLPIRGSYMLSP